MPHDISTPEYRFTPQHAVIGAQMLFVAFGALVLALSRSADLP